MASVSSTRATISSCGRSRCRGPKATSSRTVGLKSWASALWNTMPTRRRNPWAVGLVAQCAAVDARAEGLDGAARGLDEAGEELEQGRLSRAVGAEYGEALAAVDRQVDRGERLDPGAVVVAHAGQAEEGAGCSGERGAGLGRIDRGGGRRADR